MSESSAFLWRPRTKLGDILTDLKLVTDEQVQLALAHQAESGMPFGESLLHLGYIGEDDLSWALSSQLDLPFIAVTPDLALPELLEQYPADFMRQNLVLPLLQTGDSLSVVLADPTQEAIINRLEQISGCELNIAVGTPTAIRMALDEILGPSQDAEVAVQADTTSKRTLASPELAKLLERALLEGASLIHLDPEGDQVRVRFRLGDQVREGGWFEPKALNEVIEGLGNWMGEAREVVPGVRRWEPEEPSEGMPMEAFAVGGEQGTSLTIILESQNEDDAQLTAAFEEEWNQVNDLLQSPRGLLMGVAPTGPERVQLLNRILGHLQKMTRRAWILAPEDIKIPRGVARYQGARNDAAVETFCSMEGVDVLIGVFGSLNGASHLLEAASQDRLVIAVLPGSSALELLGRLRENRLSSHLLASATLGIIAQRIIAGASGQTRRAISEILVADRPLRLALQNGGSMNELREAARSQGFVEIAQRTRALGNVDEATQQDLERHRYLEDAA